MKTNIALLIEQSVNVIDSLNKGLRLTPEEQQLFCEHFEREEIKKNENMEAYSAAASQMEEMAQYISKMIGLFFDGQDPETCEIPDESCTHNCSTCGGCH